MAFTRAVRSFTPLLIGIAGPTGSGKTFSALRLAGGLSGNGRIAFIDTECGRALQYDTNFPFDHDTLDPPFTPERYQEKIEEASNHVGPGGCIIVDSCTHEWDGPGGLLETASNKAHEMAERASESRGGRYVSPDTYTFPSWREPKQRHQRMVNRILQLRCHAIFCFRAKEKFKLQKGERGRQEVVSQGLLPIMEENFPYEMTLFAMVHADRPGVPLFTYKALAEPFKGMFNDKPLSEEQGKKLAAWAAGGAKGASTKREEHPPAAHAEPPDDDGRDYDPATDESAKPQDATTDDRMAKFWARPSYFIKLNGGGPSKRAMQLDSAMKAAPDEVALRKLWIDNEGWLDEMRDETETAYNALAEAFDVRLALLGDEATGPVSETGPEGRLAV